MKLSRGLFVGSSVFVLALGGAGLIACGSDDNSGFPSTVRKDASTINSGDDASSAGDDASLGGDDDATINTGGDDDGDATTGDDTGTGPGAGDASNGDDGSTIVDGGGGTTDAGDASDGAVVCKGSAPKIPNPTLGNYCFGANGDAGCSGATPVCCDETVSKKFVDVCVATLSDCTVTSDAGADAGDAGDAGIVTAANAYACNKPSDCASGKKCYLSPSATFDGGALAADSCGKVATGTSKGTVCTSDPGAADIQLCSTNADCPVAHPTCTAIVYSGDDFGACE